MAAKNNPSSNTIETTDDIAQPDATEPTKAEILADLRQALKEALSGAGRPAREALAELQRKSIDDANAS